MSESDNHFALVTRGVRLRELRRFEESETALKEALSMDPEDDFAVHQLAVTQYFSPNGGKKALDTVGRAIALSPNDPDHHVLKAFILIELGRGKEAFRSAKDAIEQDPNHSNAHAAQAGACLVLSQNEAAERCAREALSLDPGNDVAAKYLAHSLRLQGKMEENAEQIRRMLENDPNDNQTHTVAGYSRLQTGDAKGAETHFLEALRLNPGNEYARNGLLESFRARSALYRLHLRWTMWMESKSASMQWAIIIGIYLVIRLLRLLRGTRFEILGIILGILYGLVVFWMHVARGVGNLMIICDSSARYALNKAEKIDGIVVGGGIMLGLMILTCGLALDEFGLVVPGITLMVAAIPFSYVFTNQSKIGRWVFSSFALLILGAGLLMTLSAFAPTLFTKDFERDVIVPAAIAGMIAALATTWLSGIPSLRRQA